MLLRAFPSRDVRWCPVQTYQRGANTTMFRKAVLTMALSSALSAPAFAQFDGGNFGPAGGFHGGFSGGAGNAGAQRRNTQPTGAQAWQDGTPDVNTGTAYTAAPGQTFTTGRGSLNAGDVRGPLLPPTTTAQLGGPQGIPLDLDHLPPTSLAGF